MTSTNNRLNIADYYTIIPFKTLKFYKKVYF